MSYNWMLVRGGNANPSSLKFTAMMNKQNIAENEIFKPETNQPKILSKSTEDLVLLQDPFSFKQLRFINNMHYYGPFEPDGDKLSYWCRFNHIASKIKDHSFSGNYTVPVGNPRLCEGPSDGTVGGTIVSRINTRDTLDYFYTPDSSRIRINNMTVGFSEYLEFVMEKVGTAQLITTTVSTLPTIRGIKPTGFKSPGFKLSTPGGTTTVTTAVGEDAMVQMKMDDALGDYGRMLKVGVNGELKWFVRRNGTTRNFISANNKITLGLYYAVCLVYDAATNGMTMRINNEPQSDSADETPTFPTNHDLSMFHGIGVAQNQEKMVGRWKDSRHYNEMKFTNSQMDNIWNNKRSISPIQYGHLAVASVSRFNETVFAGGYDATAYDSTGFEVI